MKKNLNKMYRYRLMQRLNGYNKQKLLAQISQKGHGPDLVMLEAGKK